MVPKLFWHQSLYDFSYLKMNTMMTVRYIKVEIRNTILYQIVKSVMLAVNSSIVLIEAGGLPQIADPTKYIATMAR